MAMTAGATGRLFAVCRHLQPMRAAAEATRCARACQQSQQSVQRAWQAPPTRAYVTTTAASGARDSSSGGGGAAVGGADRRQHQQQQEGVDKSWIERVKVSGANALLGPFMSSSGFSSFLTKMNIDRIGDGTVTASLIVDDDTANSYGTLHGGCTATIVDIVGTIALLTLDPKRPGVSVDINVSYVSAAKKGESVTITGRVLKTGRKLGFTEVDLHVGDKLVATGRHTKAL